MTGRIAGDDIDPTLMISDAPSSTTMGTEGMGTDDLSTTEVATDDLDYPYPQDSSSLKVRLKYGLSCSSQTTMNEEGEEGEREREEKGPALGHSKSYEALGHSKSYEEIFMSVDDSMINFSPQEEGSVSRQYGREVATLLAIVQSLARHAIDELVVTGLTMENEHALLEPLCRMVEVALYHGLRLRWGRKNGLWSLLEKIPFYAAGAGSASAVENVRQFTSLSTGSSRIRAWIMLALMNKCLGADLELLFHAERDAVKGLYEDWALVRSDQFATLVCLLGSLESIDFNLYIQEQAIPKGPFALDWPRFLAADGVHFSACSPPIPMPPFILSKFTTTTSTTVSRAEAKQGDPARRADTESNDTLMARIERLEGENRQLRRSIISQLNQRSFFEEEAAKLGKRLAKLQGQLDALVDANQQLQATEGDLRAVIAAHEASNQSLQYQLGQLQLAPTPSPPNGTAQSAAQSIVLSHRSTDKEADFHSAGLGLEERVRLLEFELKMANAIRAEYKARLQAYEQRDNNN